MKNPIKTLEIENFKSIKSIKMDCRRVNILIGKPNVGKSNILEALSLYCLPTLSPSNQGIFKDYIRYESINNLMYDGERTNQVSVKSDIGFAGFNFQLNNINAYDFYTGPDNSVLSELKDLKVEAGNTYEDFFNRLGNSGYDVNKIRTSYARAYETSEIFEIKPFQLNYHSPIKKYKFSYPPIFDDNFSLYLKFPDGKNLFAVVEADKKLQTEFGDLFGQYGLRLMMSKTHRKLAIAKIEDNTIIEFPYSLIADTLLRYIFHITAIKSNQDSILLFEEPENHSFPPYIKSVAQTIIDDESNQFFIATHSPYFLMPLIEKCPPDELAIFVARYEDYETKIKLLSDEEIQQILDSKIDPFFNVDAFQN